MTLIKRILSSIVLLSVSFYALIKGDIVFWGLITIITSLCLFEILQLKKIAIYSFNSILSFISIFLLLFSLLNPDYSLIWTSKTVLILANLIVCVSLVELFQKKLLITQGNRLITLYSLIFMSLTLPFAIIIRSQHNGLLDLFLILLVIASTDSSAYFIGRFFGKRPLSSVSPKKTIEGSIAGTMTGIGLGILFLKTYGYPSMPYIPLLFLVSLLAQLGDLHQSLNKRYYNVKDSSQLIPGHGGFYDRLDAYLLVLPVFVIVKQLFV